MSSAKSTKVAAEKVIAAVAPVVAEKKVKAVKTETKPKVEVKAVVAPVVAVVAAPVEKKQRAKKVKAVEESKTDAVEKKEVVKRGPATAESVMTELVSLIDSLSKSNLSEVKEVKTAMKGLRSTASRLKGLRNDLTRVLKKTNKTKAPKDKTKLTNSGLMKPVAISKELTQFMGVPADSLHSRVSVTNAICTYIKEKNLQNPVNKRQINPDANLSKILGYKAESGQPLTYFYIQQLIQPHFIKEVSSELCKFMGVADRTLVSTSAIVSSVTAYATKKGLVHDGNVTFDETLTKLFGKAGVVPTSTLNQVVKSQFKK
jgi:chromatin remodeling complex protein RSC6